jgi:hypothetical protein
VISLVSNIVFSLLSFIPKSAFQFQSLAVPHQLNLSHPIMMNMLTDKRYAACLLISALAVLKRTKGLFAHIQRWRSWNLNFNRSRSWNCRCWLRTL